MKFLEQICERAKADKKTIVLPEGNDTRTLLAAQMIVSQGIANVIVLGDAKNIIEHGEEINLSGVTVIDPLKYGRFEEFANDFYEMRKAKGMTIEKAREQMKDVLYFGVMMVKKGMADGMVAGAVHSTANTVRPALQILKTAPVTKMVSSFFVMVVPKCGYGYKGTFVYSDSGLVENPTAEELSEIAIEAAKSFETLVQAEPKVGMLSYSTYGSAKSELTEKVVEATKLAKEKAPNLKIDGEFQLDAAIVPAIGNSKAPGSDIAGHANVLVFPDLNAGNIGYKLTERLARAEAYGPILQGVAKPVNDLSRGCSAEDIVGVVAITCVQAQNVK